MQLLTAKSTAVARQAEETPCVNLASPVKSITF